MANLITSIGCRSGKVDILSFRFRAAGYVCSYWYAHKISVFAEKVGEMEQSGDTSYIMDTIFSDKQLPVRSGIFFSAKLSS
jgi:hypothetical protein